MSRKQDFSQSTIYHIRVIETKMVAYLGSTTNFRQRCAIHKYDYNHDSTSAIYKFIRDNGGFDLFEIIPVAFLQLNNSIELRMEEQKEMDKHTDKLNAMKAYFQNRNELIVIKKSIANFMSKIKINIRSIIRNTRNNIRSKIKKD